MKKNLLFGLLAFVLCISLAGCGKKAATIVGSWVSKDYGDAFTYTFNDASLTTYPKGFSFRGLDQLQ